jgi:hypothetical protein
VGFFIGVFPVLGYVYYLYRTNNGMSIIDFPINGIEKLIILPAVANPFFWLPSDDYRFFLVCSTPVLFFIYGWGIHSLFRKISPK